MAAPSPKRAKTRKTRFRKEYTKTWNFIIPSKKGVEFALCTFCDKDIKITAGGGNDIERHMITSKHVACSKSKQSMLSIPSMFAAKMGSSENPLEEKVRTAEHLFSNFFIEHNLPLDQDGADHASEIFKKMFPDSEIAKKFKCSRQMVEKLKKEQQSTDDSD